MNSRPSRADFWLGARGETKVTDFDGQMRACFRLGAAHLRSDPTYRYLWVRVDPPMPLSEGRDGQEVALKEKWEGVDIDQLANQWLAVYVLEVINRSAFELGVVEQADFRLLGLGEVARSPSLLPPSQEEEFDDMFALLQRFVAREGHADVPPDHREEDRSLGIWVANMKYSRAWRDLRPGWESRLEALPGWRWLSGDDFFLLGRFAIAYGHTRVPLDYVDEGRPIGQWVNELRKTHALGMLSKDWIQRLEKIPGWEW